MLAQIGIPMALPFPTKSSFSHPKLRHTIDIYHASLVILSGSCRQATVPFNRPFRICWRQSLVNAKLQTISTSNDLKTRVVPLTVAETDSRCNNFSPWGFNASKKDRTQ
jgi:hypothetical protein